MYIRMMGIYKLFFELLRSPLLKEVNCRIYHLLMNGRIYLLLPIGFRLQIFLFMG